MNNEDEVLDLKSAFKEKYFGNCRSVEEFEKIEEIGEGTYGKVCKI
jgi:hypothetical protein